MVVADISPTVARPTEDTASLEDVDVRLDVHDASRLEWSVTLPLDARKSHKYAIELELDIPVNVFARHSPWDQMQSYARLDGPAAAVKAGESVTIDALRRGAISFAHKLARASEGFSRHCRLAGALSAMAPREELEEGLVLWIRMATMTTEQARTRLGTASESDSAELRRERTLVDEYVSVRLLEMLASAERAVASLTETKYAATYEAAIVDVEGRLAEALENEIAYRQRVGYLCADPDVSATLERYLDRASSLKKHFQEVLFLEAETYQVAERIHHLVAVFVAILASTWAFAWQIALMNRQPSAESTVGSGIVVLAVIAGLVYAAKDRMKELGRTWISGNVHRFYAQRVARWRAPARRLRTRDVVIKARESFDQAVMHRPDPLNPDSGATVASTIIQFTHKGHVMAQAPLVESGVRKVKHIFRYDLSPLFNRLDDAVKKVPVLDKATRRVSFTDAPRCYRVPVRLHVNAGTKVRDQRAILVLHKRGLDRLEFEEGADLVLETGLLPELAP